MSNHIDLTLDDPQDSTTYADAVRYAKRPRTDLSPWLSQESTPSPPSQVSPSMTTTWLSHSMNPVLPSTSMSLPQTSQPAGAPRFGFRPPPYRPLFAGNSFHPPDGQQSTPPASSSSLLHYQQQLSAQPLPSPRPPEQDIIDLTSSPSPPPARHLPGLMCEPQLPPELAPKTPICIGQFSATALILYPDQYTLPQSSGDPEWVPVRLQYEHDPNKPSGRETIHIKTPTGRGINGESVTGDRFGMIEQKVADSIGPMLARGLIRLESKIRKGSGVPFLPLQLLVYTPKGNIPVVGKYLRDCNILLDHPSYPFDLQRLHYLYSNPHDPPPGGHNRSGALMMSQARWQTPSAKSVEIQRGQIDELFKNLKDGDGLTETDPCFEIAPKLYPHQKKALTFLLDREKEQEASGGFSSLWQKRCYQLTGRTLWLNVITQKEVYEAPKEPKGAILADDMGLGKTITCISLIGATLDSSIAFAASPLDIFPPPPRLEQQLESDHFSGSVWGMPDTSQGISRPSTSAKAKAKAERLHDKQEAEYTRHSRIKVKSRATLIICPLSTVSNWEDQFRDHWKGDVSVVGGSGGVCGTANGSTGSSQPSGSQIPIASEPDGRVKRANQDRALRIYVYHGNARRPDPSFLANFDAVITTYATLATEFSKQTKSLKPDDDDDDPNGGDVLRDNESELEEAADPSTRHPKLKTNGKRKKPPVCTQTNNSAEISSALQSVHWFRVVLDEAHYIKETGTVACRACCDLMADRRLCLTGTPVQNKLDDVFALIKFLRLHPLDDKNVWTEYIGSPVKFGQALGIARLQTIMKCITLRRTKDAKAADGSMILALPPRREELRLLKFEPQEQEIYDKFFKESKDEFTDLSQKNEVMKNYVGILQKILRLRQICDHFELVEGKEIKPRNENGESSGSFEDITTAIETDGFNYSRAAAVFAILCESATAQCVECGSELGVSSDLPPDTCESETQPPLKRGRKYKTSASRPSTRANSPDNPRPVLTRCQHLFCLVCYRNSICPGWPNVAPDIKRACSACQTALSSTDAFEISHEAMEYNQKKKERKRERRPKGLCLENFVPSTKIKSLLQDLVQFSSMNPHSRNYDSELEMSDSSGVKIEPDVVKTVVFSQWTSMLDKVEDALQLAGIRYGRLDGTMKRDERIRAMDSLKLDPGCEVLLVSLKAGGVGLNLTAAQRVYLLDPYWNPAVENQAVDRIHRLGQTRTVTTVKLIIENSIEARLLEVQRKKTELANMTLKNVSKAEILSRRMEELAELFKS